VLRLRLLHLLLLSSLCLLQMICHRSIRANAFATLLVFVIRDVAPALILIS